MMYVAVKGGERAIRNAHALLAERRRGNRDTPELTPAQIDEQLALAVDRVMSEGSLYDRSIAALAIKQARGDLIEAIFLVRAYRTTLSRFGYSEPVETGRMAVRRRISATFKDVPGGQILGPTFDYTHRLIDFSLEEETPSSCPSPARGEGTPSQPPQPAPSHRAKEGGDEPVDMPRVLDILGADGLIEPARKEPATEQEPGDITR